MQLRTVSDAFLAAGYEFHPKATRIVGDTEGDIHETFESTPFSINWSQNVDWESESPVAAIST